MKAIDLVKLVHEKRKKYFKNWKYHVKIIKGLVKAELGEVRVYAFGSIIRGNAHPALSDIDVLIVSPNVPVSNEERVKIKAMN